MTVLTWQVLRQRWPLLVGTLLAIALGVGLVHAGLSIGTTIASAHPPAGLTEAERLGYVTRLNGTNTINGIASMLGIFLTVFVVRSTVDFAVTQRRRELALLRLAGVKRGQLRRMLLTESFVLGVVGTLMGSVLGLGIAAVQRGLYVRMGVMPADVSLGWEPVHLAMDAAVGVGVALAGARAASVRATRVRPLDGLGFRGLEARLMTRSRWVWGTFALVLTGAQLIGSMVIGGFLGPLLMGLGIVITGSIAASQFAPTLVPATALTLRRLLPGPLGALAVAKVRHDARRAAQVAAPLIVLVSLVAGLQGLLDTQTRTGEREILATTRADLIVTTKGDPTARIAAVRGVASADVQIQVPAKVTVTHHGRTTRLPGPVWALDPARFAAMHPYRPVEGRLDQFTDTSMVIGPGVENAQVASGVTSVTVSIGGKQHTLRQAARTGEGLATTDGAYIPLAVVPDQVVQTSPSMVLVTLAPGASPGEVRAAVAGLGVGAVTTPAESIAEQNATKSDENRAVMAALVGVGSIYALISLLSTLAIATAQRRSEFAVDRLTGLTRRQVTLVTLLESLITIGIGMVLGVAVSVLATAGLWVATTRSFGSPVIAVPWFLLAGMTLVVGLLASITTWIATRAATNRLPVHDLITQE